MKMTDWARRALASRREQRRMRRGGWDFYEGPWEMHRGNRMDHVIVEVRIGAGKKGVWIKTEPLDTP